MTEAAVQTPLIEDAQAAFWKSAQSVCYGMTNGPTFHPRRGQLSAERGACLPSVSPADATHGGPMRRKPVRDAGEYRCILRRKHAEVWRLEKALRAGPIAVTAKRRVPMFQGGTILDGSNLVVARLGETIIALNGLGIWFADPGGPRKAMSLRVDERLPRGGA